MTDIDRINELSQSVASMREKYKPYSAADPNLRLYNALGMAQDQLEYAAHILHQREPDPRQPGFFDVQIEGDVIKGNVMITPPEPKPSGDNWCGVCQNPRLVCTCPGRGR